MIRLLYYHYFYEGKIEVKQEFSELNDNGISQFSSIGTYTIPTMNGKRIHKSGPMSMH